MAWASVKCWLNTQWQTCVTFFLACLEQLKMHIREYGLPRIPSGLHRNSSGEQSPQDSMATSPAREMMSPKAHLSPIQCRACSLLPSPHPSAGGGRSLSRWPSDLPPPCKQTSPRTPAFAYNFHSTKSKEVQWGWWVIGMQGLWAPLFLDIQCCWISLKWVHTQELRSLG